MLDVLENEKKTYFLESGEMRNTYTRYHICLMRVPGILLLSIQYNVCVCHNPVYHYIIATAVYLTQRFARYHICLMRVFIILLSIRYNVCVCYDPVYYYITLLLSASHNVSQLLATMIFLG